jgi:hypothetical protein
MSNDQIIRGRNTAREILESARLVNDRLKRPLDLEVEQAMGRMIKDMSDLLGQTVVTIDRMRRAPSIERARQIGNEFLADLGR